MSALTDTVRVAPATNPISQSFRDSMVVAKRNLIRMSRIPNPVHGASIQFSSPPAHGQRLSGGKGQPK
jgi:ABC-2 type transport system permease protein